MTPGRAAAFAIRLETERGRRLDRALGDAASSLDARERGFAHELSYGVTRLRGRLDHLISPHVARGLDSVDPTVLELLRLGTYQSLYMDSVPAYAAVSSTVDQVKAEVGPRPAGFVNAVLRKVQTAGDGRELFPDEHDHPLEFLTSWGSHPEWLIERWLRRWSPSEVKAIVEADNRRPTTCLVPLGMSPVEAVELLGRVGIGAAVVGVWSGCVRLEQRGDVAAALAAIPDAVVQDPAANLVSLYSDVPSGTMVADLCAAPGGKSLAVSDRPAAILAADRSESRIRMVRDNVRRTGRSMTLVVADALHPPVRQADVVLLDVPCSGTGTLARHPDARWRLEAESIGRFAELQAALLESAADVVAPGGLLVYSTCTLEAEENEERVEALLGDRSDFVVEASDAVTGDFVDGQGYLRVDPQDLGYDGSFAVRMRKVG